MGFTKGIYQILSNSDFPLQNMPMLTDGHTESYSNTSADLKVTGELTHGTIDTRQFPQHYN